jgi:hypothetical protein
MLKMPLRERGGRDLIGHFHAADWNWFSLAPMNL